MTYEHICPEPGCGKSFETYQALAAHGGSHKLRGEYRCPECEANGLTTFFALPQHLGAHRLKAHGIPGSTKTQWRAKKKRERQKQRQVPVQVEIQAESMGLGLAQYPPAVELEANLEAIAARNGQRQEVAELIKFSTEPLIERYRNGYQWLAEVAEEEVRVLEELNALWVILRAMPGLDLEPPPGIEEPEQVMIGFTKPISDHLVLKAAEWAEQRRNHFDVQTMAREMNVSSSTAQRAINILRSDGRVRMVGKKGHAKLYSGHVPGAG